MHNQLQPGVKTAGYEYVNYEDTNSNSSYVARVALGIKSSQSRKLEGADGAGGMFCAKESVKVKESVSEFVAFAMISEVSQIDPGYRSKLSFRLCVGKLLGDFLKSFSLNFMKYELICYEKDYN